MATTREDLITKTKALVNTSYMLGMGGVGKGDVYSNGQIYTLNELGELFREQENELLGVIDEIPFEEV